MNHTVLGRSIYKWTGHNNFNLSNAMQSKISKQSMLFLRGLRPTPLKIRPSKKMFLEEIKMLNP